MPEGTKIHLSQREFELVINSEWILTKHHIINKVYEMFGALLEQMKTELSATKFTDKESIPKNGKISKGENYNWLPYVILDYPRLFGKTNTFAIRSMFWWGNFFSSTLHVKGDYKTAITKDPAKCLLFLQEKNYSLCINEDEWEHHFNEDNYIAATNINLKAFQQILEKDFLKIGKKIPLTQWDNAFQFLLANFRELMNITYFNFPNGETDL